MPKYTKLLQGDAFPIGAKLWDSAKDNETGLIWEVKTEQNKDDTYTYDEAKEYIERLNAERFGGFDDWRVPGRLELESLLDLSKHNPAIDTDYFPNAISASYRTSTPGACFSTFAWCVDFYSGYVNYNHKSGSYCVRAVRGGKDQSRESR